MTRASIVVAAFNVAPYLSRCVESLLAQSERSIEVILVDDGSTDETPALVDRYAAQDPRVKAIHRRNGGLSVARNTGLSAARGEFVCFVDGDDWVEETMVETMISRCESTASAVVIAGVHVDFHDRNDALLCSERRTLPHHQIHRGIPVAADLVDENLVNLLGYAWNKMYRTGWLSGLGVQFEEGLTLVEDIVFNSLVLAAADRVVLVPEAFVHYVQRPRETLGTRRDETFLALRFRAVESLDSLLDAWGVDEAHRAERRARASAMTLWTALTAAASSPRPKDLLRRMLEQPGVDALVAHAKAADRADWRGRWATETLRRRWYGVALLPAHSIQAIRRVAHSLKKGRPA